MRNRLSRGFAVIDANVEAGRRELLLDHVPNLGDELPDLVLFVPAQVEDAGHVSTGHDQRVAVSKWEGVVEADCGGIARDDRE